MVSFIKLSPCLNFVIYIIFRTNDRLCLPLHLANFLLITRHLSLSFSLYKKKNDEVKNILHNNASAAGSLGRSALLRRCRRTRLSRRRRRLSRRDWLSRAARTSRRRRRFRPRVVWSRFRRRFPRANRRTLRKRQRLFRRRRFSHRARRRRLLLRRRGRAAPLILKVHVRSVLQFRTERRVVQDFLPLTCCCRCRRYETRGQYYIL